MSGIVNAPQVWLANMTPAQQALYSMARGGRPSTGRRKRRAGKTKTMRRRKARASAASPRRRKRRGSARLVKGSAAAKRYMAKIRRKRKR